MVNQSTKVNKFFIKETKIKVYLVKLLRKDNTLKLVMRTYDFAITLNHGYIIRLYAQRSFPNQKSSINNSKQECYQTNINLLVTDRRRR